MVNGDLSLGNPLPLAPLGWNRLGWKGERERRPYETGDLRFGYGLRDLDLDRENFRAIGV